MNFREEVCLAKILCVLYGDPVGGHPLSYARDGIPNIELYPDGQTLPSPMGMAGRPGELLGDISGRLGLQRFLAARGHTLIVTSDQGGPNSVFDRELPDAE